jgi:hypothetical protein
VKRLVHATIRLSGAADYRGLAPVGVAARAVRERQLRILLATVAANRDTEIGRALGFDRVSDYAGYARRVPIRGYDELRPLVERMERPANGILTSQPVALLEPTSGSSGPIKLIPYTAGLRGQFRHAVNAWLHDIYSHVPGARRGSHYWSVSPAEAAVAPFATTIPVGFESDAEYLGLLAPLVRRVFPVPDLVRSLATIGDFQHATALLLLAARDLTLISVWSPVFLLALLERIRRFGDDFVRDLRDGRLRLPSGRDAPAPVRPHPDPAAAVAVQAALAAWKAGGDAGALWPHLAFVSAWGDAASSGPFAELRALFPRAVVQPKGLLATEAVVSIPLFAAGGCVPAWTSHFFELVTPEGDTRLLHQLDQGRTYRVVVTTAGGLYRYDTGDAVLVDGAWGTLPLLRFVGREAVSDLAGEKLSEAFVAKALAAGLCEAGVAARFAMLAPAGRGYALFLEAAAPVSPRALAAAGAAVERALCAGYHYAYARELGQIAPLRVFHVQEDGRGRHLERLAAEGQRVGAIKPAVLDRRLDWDRVFRGEYLP